jgi:hypothetical protein
VTAPEGADVTEPTLPNVWRVLPADVSDAEFMRVMDEMTAEVCGMGAPAYLVRTGATMLEDRRWLVQAWQPKNPFSWDYPTVDPQDYALPATH